MKNILLNMIGKAYAQELIPCEDGSVADPSVGCVSTPPALINSQTGLLEIILKIAEGMSTVAVTVAIITLLYGAVRYMTATGNDEAVKKAKSILFWSLIGLSVAVLARSLIAALLISVIQ